MSELVRRAHSYVCEIVAHDRVAHDTYRVRVAGADIAQQYLPGQFVMARISDCNDPLIGRALAIFDRQSDSDRTWQTFDLVYVVKGKFTMMLSRQKPGQHLDIVGPLGNAFSNSPVDHLIMVSGGVGETPMLSLAKEAMGAAAFGEPARPGSFANRISLCYGARTRDLLACVQEFENTGIDVRLSTDDGSCGPKQRVTDSLVQLLDEQDSTSRTRIVCCGPGPMMQSVSKIAQDRQIECQVSLETPMACGIGICFTCVAKIKQAEAWDYRRTCVEGPIFDASQIVWG